MMNLATGGSPFITRPVGARRSPTHFEYLSTSWLGTHHIRLSAVIRVISAEPWGNQLATGPSERKFWMNHDGPMSWGKTNNKHTPIGGNKPLFGVWLSMVDHIIYNMVSQAKSCSLSIPTVLWPLSAAISHAEWWLILGKLSSIDP